MINRRTAIVSHPPCIATGPVNIDEKGLTMSTGKIKIHVGRYLADTAHLLTAEQSIYFRLILNYYQNGSKLPDDLDKICAMVGAVGYQEWRIVDDILNEFFILMEFPFGKEWIHTKSYVIEAPNQGYDGMEPMDRKLRARK